MSRAQVRVPRLGGSAVSTWGEEKVRATTGVHSTGSVTLGGRNTPT